MNEDNTKEAKIAAKAALRDQALSRLLSRLGLSQRKGQGWRLVDTANGQVNALPSFRGRVVATDGVMCIIETEDERILLGHYDWFVKDEGQGEEKISSKKQQKQKILQEFIV